MKFSTIKNIVLVALIALFFYQLKGGKLNIGKTTVVDGKKYEIIKEIHDTTEVIKTNIKWKKGSDIDKIKNNLSKFTSNEVSLNIKEVKKPETNAYLVAENIAQQLVKRI